MSQSSDLEIRTAFHAKRLHSYHSCQDSIVIDELGVSHGRNRIDIAVLNGCIHGYEIKSSKDNLDRFADQFQTYRKCFEKLSIVVAPNHIDEILYMVPLWCGVVLAEKGPRGGIHFTTTQKPKKNPDTEVVAMAHFLWKKETVDLLIKLGADESELKGPKRNLYDRLSHLITTSELSNWIKNQFMLRGNWRAGPQPTISDGLHQLVST